MFAVSLVTRFVIPEGVNEEEVRQEAIEWIDNTLSLFGSEKDTVATSLRKFSRVLDCEDLITYHVTKNNKVMDTESFSCEIIMPCDEETFGLLKEFVGKVKKTDKEVPNTLLTKVFDEVLMQLCDAFGAKTYAKASDVEDTDKDDIIYLGVNTQLKDQGELVEISKIFIVV